MFLRAWGIVALIFFSMQHAASAETASPSNSVLMFGTVTKAKYLGLVDAKESQDAVYLGGLYTTELSALEVVRGEFAGGSIKVRLAAANKGYLKRGNRILVYAEFNQADEASNAYWWPTQTFACLSIADFERLGLKDKDAYTISDDREACLPDQELEPY